MDMLLVNILIIFCACFVPSQLASGSRIKREDVTANLTATSKDINSTLVLGAKPVTENANLTEPVALVNSSAVPPGTSGAIQSIAATAATPAAAGGVAPVAGSPVTIDSPAELKQDALENGVTMDASAVAAAAAAGHGHRNKRRMSALLEDPMLPRALHHGRHHGEPAGPAESPYVYFNKLISPDGKQEVKEFQLLSPNMVIETVQQDVNYGAAGPELGGGVLVLNADNNLNGHMHGMNGMAKPLSNHHHRKRKPSLGLPPFLYLLQQMLQPEVNLDLDAAQNHPRNRFDVMMDGALDMAMRNYNRDILKNAPTDKYIINKDKGKDINMDKDIDLNELQKLEPVKDNQIKDNIESVTSRKDDELLVSCPIHHEHHANTNGDMVDDDVVLVNECHIV